MPELKGKGLFVFSDPGGAKPILAWIDMNKKSLNDYKIISDRSYTFFNDFNVDVNTPSLIIEEDFCLKPDFVFTGTSYTSKIELRYIEIAKSLSIPTYSFVDHWTSIRKRFDNNGKEIFPDYILLLDARAKQLAVEQKIDDSKIIITGNPYYDWLAGWKPVLNKTDFLQRAGVKDQRSILLYAPDPLSNINGKKEYGFDEVTATKAFVNLFDSYREQLGNWLVLVKAHPNQHVDRLTNIISAHSSFVMLPWEVDTNTAIYYADVVAGYFSSILIEASVMKKPVLRFLDFNVKNDPIAELQIGTVVNSKNFVSTLQKIDYATR